MRVAFLINELRRGGGQRTFVDDANALASLGDDVTLFTMYPESSNSLAPEVDARVRHISLDASDAFDWRAARRCAAALRAADIRILISTLNDANVFARWVRLTSLRRILLIRREALSPRRKVLWQQLLDLASDVFTHRIFVVSEEARAGAILFAPWQRRKTRLLANAVALARQTPRERRIAPHILSVGRLTHQKGYETLLSALALLARDGVGFTAEIIGGGGLDERLRADAARAGLSDRLTIHGPLPHARVLETYLRADLFVLSSRFEGCPHVLLEAMAAGLPIVATAVGGVPDMLEQGACGRLVPPDNPAALSQALRALIAAPDTRDDLGGAARRRAALFAPERRLDALRSELLHADRVSRRGAAP